MKKVITTIGICILCFGLLASSAVGATLTSVTVSQTVQTEGQLHVFFMLTDENGRVMTNIDDDDVKISIGAQTYLPALTTVAKSDLSIGYVFAVDISKSLNDKQFAAVRAALHSWVQGMGEEDMAAIMTFGEEISVLTDFTDDTNALKTIVDSISPKDKKTQLYGGMVKAMDLAKRQSEDLPPLRMVVVLSDGEDEYPAGATVGEVTQRAKEAGVPIYVVGVEGKNNDAELSELGGIARLSGGELYNVSSDALSDGYNDIYMGIRGSYIATIPLTHEIADGNVKGLVLSVRQAGMTVEDSLDIRLKAIPAPAPVQTAAPKPKPSAAIKPASTAKPQAAPARSTADIGLFGIIGAAAVAVGLLVFLSLRKKKRKQAEAQAAQEQERRRMRELDKAIHATSGTTHAEGTSKLGGDGEGTAILRPNGRKGLTLILTDAKSRIPYTAALGHKVQVGREKTDKNGNSRNNDITIPDRAVSGVHCRFVLEDDKLYLRDLNSSNGTYVMEHGKFRFVDGGRGTQVKNGDRIRLGETELEIQLKEN